MTIDQAMLAKVRRIIVHADCPDGTASAMILHDALPVAEIIAIHYGSERDALEPEPGLLFCDMTPPDAKAAAFVEADAIVLDHHKGAAELVALFGELGVFADEETEPGVSGATLAYREVWTPVGRATSFTKVGWNKKEVGQFAELAGIRDTWQTGHPTWLKACAQAEVLMFYPLDYWFYRDVPCLHIEEEKLGRVLLNKKLTCAHELAESGCIRIGNAALFNADGRVVSDVAEAMREVDPSVEIVCGFFYTVSDGEMSLVFSMRSGPDGPDVSAIAKANGGGGHTRAAGFTLRVGTMGEPDGVSNSSPVEIFKAALVC